MATRTRKLEIVIAGDARGATRALDAIERRSGGLGRKLARFGKIAALGIGGGVAAGVGMAIKSVANFDTVMNTLQAVSGATADQMKRVQGTAIALGNDMSLPATSASDAAAAMTELAKGGLSVTEAMASAKGVLQLSAAAQIGNAEAATIAANALNAFGLKAAESVRVADLLAATANASSAEITDVAFAMQQAGAVFASNKVPIEDLTTAIGLMANAGIKGSDAGTSLKTMLTRLLAAGPKARGMLDHLGVSVFNAAGEFVGMKDIIKQFGKGLKGVSDEERIMALNVVFGSDAIRAANVVLGGGTKKWDAMRKAVTKGGAASKVAGAKMKGLGGAFQGLQSIIETIVLTIGLKIGPPLEKLVRLLAKKLPGAMKTAERIIKPIAKKIGMFFKALFSGVTEDEGSKVERVALTIRDIFLTKLLPALKAVGRFITEKLLPAVRKLFNFLMDHKEILVGVAVAIGTFLVAAFVSWAASATLAAAATLLAVAPIILVGAAIAALVAGVIYAYKHWGWFRAAVDAVWRFLKNTFWPNLKEGWRILMEQIVPAVKELIEQIGNIIGVAREVARVVIEKFIQVRDKLRVVWDKVVEFVSSAKRRIISILDGMLGPIDELIGKLLKAIGLSNNLQPHKNIGYGTKTKAGVGPKGAGLPTGAFGGVVPGPLGKPALLMLHGGETVLPTHLEPLPGGSSKLTGTTYQISVQVAPGTSPAETGRAIVEQIKAFERSSGASWRAS